MAEAHANTVSLEKSAVDQRIAEMRRRLDAMTPATTADRLKMLRERFPDVPLGKRVQALSGRHG
jgi:hypothetical protein